jgi:hypothetical protein
MSASMTAKYGVRKRKTRPVARSVDETPNSIAPPAIAQAALSMRRTITRRPSRERVASLRPDPGVLLGLALVEVVDGVAVLSLDLSDAILLRSDLSIEGRVDPALRLAVVHVDIDRLRGWRTTSLPDDEA